ncbi:MAG: hypothetical protein ABJH68_17415 [Ilumatobacter sp.]|uniref:hypothetical protein n=1 Tax=Ilumatobacter sp. TaxID=1967498 RepID=UPI00329985EF
MSDLAEPAGELADQLDRIADRIDELAFAELREAVADGDGKRPDTDKRLMQARRAIDKAAHLLRSLDQGL